MSDNGLIIAMKPKDKRFKYKNVYKVTDDAVHGFFEDHRFLSNYHICEIIFEDREYTSTESAYQSAKFPDSMRKQFQHISPVEAKKLGNALKLNRDQRDAWDMKRLDVMEEVCKYKFHNNHEVRKKLLETGDRYLEETNYWGDVWWGVYQSKGYNHLGKLLMKIRSGLKD